jgi:hypothetical protein
MNMVEQKKSGIKAGGSLTVATYAKSNFCRYVQGGIVARIRPPAGQREIIVLLVIFAEMGR